jgi:hypothetical protein
VNGILISGRTMLENWGADQQIAIAGNLFLFGVTFLSFLIAKKGLQSDNPHAFVRSIYTSLIIKLFLCIIAAFIYISYYRSGLNKPALFTIMGLYLIYTFIEVSILTRLVKQKKNE